MSGPLAYRQALSVARYRRAMAWQRTISAITYVAGCSLVAAFGILLLSLLTLLWGATL